MGLHQDLHEGGAVDRVAAKARIHQIACVVERAQGACRQAFEAHPLLENQKSFQNRVRLALVQVVADHVDHAGFVVEARVDRPQLVGGRVEPLFDIEQQNLVELGDGFGRPVVALHQRFAGAHQRAFAVLRQGGAVAKMFGHGGLQIKHQPVFAPARQVVQAGADQKQQRLVAFDALHFKRRGQPVGAQLGPTAPQPGGARHPQNHLQIAQAAGRLFAIGLQRVGRVLEAAVALAHLQGFGDQKGLRVHGGRKRGGKALHQRGIAADPPVLQKRGLHRHVFGRFGQAFGHGAHAGANLQPRVPAAADKLFHAAQGGFVVRAGFIGKQDQHIHIGIRKELPASVAPNRQQRHPGRQLCVGGQRAQGCIGVL